MSHADEVITDVNTKRIVARAHDDAFTIAWDYPGRTLLEVRILKSTDGFAADADPAGAEGAAQEVVYEDVTGSFRDAGLDPEAPVYYTVFARPPEGAWTRWGEYAAGALAAGTAGTEASRASREGVPAPSARVPRASAGTLALCLLFALAAFFGLPALAGASGSGSGNGSGSKTPKPAATDPAVSAAAAAAETDASIAAVLAGKDATVEATPWGGASAADAAGITLTYRWAASAQTSIDESWPVLRSGDSTPQAPYSATTYRIRADGVTALRVDVLTDGGKVIQALPVDGDTRFDLREQTWAPFSWLPWFTSHPWVLAPVFIVIAVVLMVRAWLRSRAWNRRLPSMTRHDRQFIGRLAILLFLVAGLLWQIYEGWFAATGPTVGSSSSSAGQLASLPLLLIPPALFVAGLVLELSAMPRRGSWALLAVLASAGSVFYLATAVTGVTANLDLTYFILLAVLALIAIPRAFSAGKMGWSRMQAPRYG